MPVVQSEPIIRRDLLMRFLAARQQSDALFQLLHDASFYERPIPERHRFVFYLGHLEAFDWNLLRERVAGTKPFHPELDRLFAFGIDPVGGGLPSDQPSDWPALSLVRDYVARVRSALDTNMEGEIPHSSINSNDEAPLDCLLNVAIEHRLMHVETLAYMLHQLAFDKKMSQTEPGFPGAAPALRRMIEIPSGAAHLGMPRARGEFGWDNEFEVSLVEVPAFEIDQFQVTNGQYAEFIAAGGYETRAFWSDDDWNWKTRQGISHPVFWKQVGDQWRYQTMFREIPLPHDWPVYVSHAEGWAYARWAGKSLPTEAEWHRAAYGTQNGTENLYPWGADAPRPDRGNFDLVRWSPAPVNAFPAGRSAFGVDGLLGNGWEWTSTVFAPFPGFQPFPFYRGYSADFFDGKHFVTKGGSARTAACMLRRTFRNWFQPHYQYVYAGFRCVNR
jgi:gamma-glutamyl hercynylcysteine S-oxide synthase